MVTAHSSLTRSLPYFMRAITSRMEITSQVAGNLTSSINFKWHSRRTNWWAQLSIFLVKFIVMSRFGLTITSSFVYLKQTPYRTALVVFNSFLVHFTCSAILVFLSLQILIVYGTTESWAAVVVWVTRIWKPPISLICFQKLEKLWAG